MKKFLSIILTIAMIMVITGCGVLPNPDNFADDFCESIRTYDLNTFGNYIGKDVTTLPDQFYDAEWYGLLGTVESTNYEIIQKTEGNDTNKTPTVSYVIKFEYNNLEPIYAAAWDNYISMGLDEAFKNPNTYNADAVWERAYEQAFLDYEPVRTSSNLSLVVRYNKDTKAWEMLAYQGAAEILAKGL